MTTFLIGLAVFAVAYLINAGTITVFYHRALAHTGVEMSPLSRWYLKHIAIWVTGIDPVGWAVMHRRHHAFSDTEQDPHSPVHAGFFGVIFAQLKSYERVLVGLARNRPEYTRYAKDMPFGVNKLNRNRIWWMPYALHFVIALALIWPAGWFVAACYFFGMMGHPVEGWVINSFGHAIGKRNFDTNDNSRNSHIAAYLVMGEGYQNNHHAFPASPKFSYRGMEWDFGYTLCQSLALFGLVRIKKENIIKNVIAKNKRSEALVETEWPKAA